MNQEYTLIKAPRLIDVQTSEVIKYAAVLFKETKIVSAGPAVSLNLPTEANIKTLEYPNKTIMPGLIDCHVHLISLGDVIFNLAVTAAGLDDYEYQADLTFDIELSLFQDGFP